MQSRYFFFAERGHIRLRLQASCKTFQIGSSILPKHGFWSRSCLPRSQRPPIHNIDGYKQVTLGLCQMRMSHHGSQQGATAARADLEEATEKDEEEQIDPPVASTKSKLSGKSYQMQAIQICQDALRNKDTKATPKPSKGQAIGKRTHKPYTSRRGSRRRRLSPPASLALWLDAKSDLERLSVWDSLDHRCERWESSLPTVLLRYLHDLQASNGHEGVAAHLFETSSARTLQKYGFSIDDVRLWASITTASTNEDAARQYLSSPETKPTFVLLEILRRPRLSVISFRRLLIHSWDRLQGFRVKDDIRLVEGDVNYLPIIDLVSLPTLSRNLSNGLLEETTFTVLISRLLRHARQVWAPAVTSISRMTIMYCKQLSGDPMSSEKNLSSKLHARISKIYNMVMRRLALPASITPMRSMTYNWHAQRLLLESAGQFSPPLHLDKHSYRAVCQVLGASKKSQLEEKYASLLLRSWPPWRKEQDGMDVERSPDEDISRPVAANFRMMEAGYAGESIDGTIKILGGRDSDGTPTVPTRAFTKVRSMRRHDNDESVKTRSNRDQKAARIMATRDAREAWAAFLDFSGPEGRPTHAMYHAMFEKLIFHAAADCGSRNSEALPGDAKEVMPFQDDNLSESERLRTQPPSFNELYSQMIRSGIRPSGRFLEMLIVHANDITEVRMYLQDSGMGDENINRLTRTSARDVNSYLVQIPDQILLAYVRFVSQRARRDKSINTTLLNLFLAAFELVKNRQLSSPVALYALVSGIAQTRVQFGDSNREQENNIMAWQVVMAAVNDFQKAGGHLDPYGLQLVCKTLEKAIPALDLVYNAVPAPARDAQQFVKAMFANLSASVEPKYGLPKLLHRFEASHLHAYVRVMCLSQDIDEVLSVLRWMVEHQEELKSTAEQSRNGPKLLRRALVATRALLDPVNTLDHKLLSSIRDLVKQLDGWGGWPTDEEVVEYVRNSVGGVEGDDKRQTTSIDEMDDTEEYLASSKGKE